MRIAANAVPHLGLLVAGGSVFYLLVLLNVGGYRYGVSDQPIGTNFLTDPSHVWRYGTSLRAASGRDVYLEEIKDIGIAIYLRETAHNVAQRIADLGAFNTLQLAHARALARRYDLDYLITEREVSLPLTPRFGRFTIYNLASSRSVLSHVQPVSIRTTRRTD